MVKILLPRHLRMEDPEFLFQNILPEEYKTGGDESVLHEFNIQIKNKSILFYPSSGIDINDLIYVNSNSLEEINEYNPKVFIHSDYSDYGSLSLDILLRDHNFVATKFEYFDDKKSINLYKLKQSNSDEIEWLVFFHGYYNEEILKELIINKIKIPLVYTICDGITHGMGGGYENSIPTILYPLIASDLGINFIITEQGWDRTKYILEDENSEMLRIWLQNILLITNSDYVTNLLNLNDEELKNSIWQKLE